MFTYKSSDFVFAGFIMVLSASFLSGIRYRSLCDSDKSSEHVSSGGLCHS